MRPSNPTHCHRYEEPEEIKGLSKAKLYKLLREKYALPKFNCRAITRSYLVGVYLGKHFRVANSDLKPLLAKLAPSDLEKENFMTVGEAVVKLDSLLKEKGQRSLGFNGDFMPDADWLFQVARCVDPCNSACFFKKAISLPETEGNDSNRVLVAQQAAERALLGDHGLLDKREIMDSLQDLSDSNKRLRSSQQEESQLRAKLLRVKDKIKEDKARVEERLTVCSVLVLNGIEPERGDFSSRAEVEEGRAKKLLKVRET
jgi:hypothetical protein